MERLKEIEQRKAEIRELLQSDKEVDLDALQKELDDLIAEEAELREKERRRAMAAKLNTGEVAPRKVETQEQRANAEDPYSSLEYRRAFMEFAKHGTPIPDGLAPKPELRADAFTGVSDAAAVVPTTIVDEIIRELKSYGHLFSRVRKLSIRGGVNVPILTLKPQATWIGEGTPSDRQKVQANSSVQFSYYGLECKVAVSLLADTVTLASFESTIVNLIVEAMAEALDKAIISGSGSGQPLGITVDPRVVGESGSPSDQVVELSEKEIGSWQAWKRKVFAKIPLAYRAGGSFIMAAGTFEGYVDGMTDENGQPVARVNYGIADAPQERFGGREVILVEDDVIAPVDQAEEGDVIAVFCRLSDYAFNSNLQLSMYRWLDHDTNQWVDKAILIGDGKILDPHGVLVITKGAGDDDDDTI